MSERAVVKVTGVIILCVRKVFKYHSVLYISLTNNIYKTYLLIFKD